MRNHLVSFGRFRHDRRGGVIVEFAFIVPIFATLLIGAVEFANFVNMNQRMDRVANTVGDFAARQDQVTPADLGNFFSAAQHIAAPHSLNADGAIILSSVQGDDASGPQVLWQQIVGGSLSAASQIGSQGGNANLPTGLTVNDGATLLVTEVYFDYQPEFTSNLISPVQVYYRAFHRPRGTNVLALAP